MCLKYKSLTYLPVQVGNGLFQLPDLSTMDENSFVHIIDAAPSMKNPWLQKKTHFDPRLKPSLQLKPPFVTKFVSEGQVMPEIGY